MWLISRRVPVSPAEKRPSPTWKPPSAPAGERMFALLFGERADVSGCSDSPPPPPPPSPLLPVVRLWLEEYSEDFQEPPDFQALRLLCSHLRSRLCFRRLAQKADVLLKRLQQQGNVRHHLFSAEGDAHFLYLRTGNDDGLI